MEADETMLAMVIEQTGAPEVLTPARMPTPKRIFAEVLVRVTAAGINPIDAKNRAGSGAAASIRSFPAILGGDFSGVVVEAPFEASPLQPGDEVFGMASVPRMEGTYAEYVAVESMSVARKPTSLSHTEAAGVPLAALTAWGAVVDVGQAHRGQRMLIHAGSGGVGHFAVQFAAHFGANVIATGSTRNQGWLRELGAVQAVDYTAERFEDVTEPVDVVIDLIGNVHDDTGSRSLNVLRPGGLIVNVPSGSWPGFLAEAQAARVHGTTYKVSPDGRTLAEIGALLDSGAVRVHIDQTFALTDAAAAHRALELGHTRGKIVLTL